MLIQVSTHPLPQKRNKERPLCIKKLYQPSALWPTSSPPLPQGRRGYLNTRNHIPHLHPARSPSLQRILYKDSSLRPGLCPLEVRKRDFTTGGKGGNILAPCTSRCPGPSLQGTCSTPSTRREGARPASSQAWVFPRGPGGGPPGPCPGSGGGRGPARLPRPRGAGGPEGALTGPQRGGVRAERLVP
jgi:hypothetical protein